MIGDPAAQQFRQTFAGERFLLRRERERIAHRDRARDRLRHFFGRVAARREDQHRRKPGVQRLRDHARPEFSHLEKVESGRLRRSTSSSGTGRSSCLTRTAVASDAPQPFHDVLRIVHAAAEEQELRFGGASASASS